MITIRRISQASFAILLLWTPGRAHAAEPLVELEKGDHIAIVGSGLADRQQHHGWLEALIHRAHPDLDLTVRNLGFAADEINVRPRSDEAPTTEYFLSMKKGSTRVQVRDQEVTYQAGTDFGAEVIFAYWGFNESFRGPEGLDAFRRELDGYLKTQRSANYRGHGAPRLVLFSPIAHENLQHPDFPDGEENNRNLALYTQVMKEVAQANQVPFVNLFEASKELYATHEAPLTINGIHLNEEGDKHLAAVQYRELFGEDPAPASDPQLQTLRAAVLDKNREWHHRYRTVDQYNIYGSRSRISYAGMTNARILGQEMAQRDVKTANRDQRIWALAKGGDLAVKDDNLPPVEQTPSNVEETVPYLSGEETIKHLKLPEGCKIELVAAEETFPELVNPVQMNFDTKGRLWVAVWPNYPETTPTTQVFDKLLVIDLDPRTGKAAKITTFLDGLNCPTGFQFYKDGVLLMQSPDLWYVKDTDGDGKADWKERVLHGLDAADSHHETNSMCLEPGGAVYLSDGVFHRSNIETIHGPVRNRDGAIYRYEPNTAKFTRHAPYGFANPHGRVFDYWGNDLITDATGNANYFGPAMSGHLDSGAHPSMKQFWNRPSRPCPGTAILSSRHFPDEWQGDFLNLNVISIQGVFRAKLTEQGSGLKGETLEHLVEADLAKAPNFRPSGITVAPDGSLYLMDWSQMLIGHLQHHLRDPNRDHQHGRLYRITYEGRPLLVPKKIDGQPIAALLELLKEPENDVRMRAKIELGKHSAKEVTDAAAAWAKGLDPRNADYEHHVLEALWVHQWHNVVNLPLLKQVLDSPEPRARAQGVRVLGYWKDRVPGALEWVKAAAEDEAPRVRLEAVRIASFFRQWEAADAALAALRHPTDDYLDYCLRETLRQLEPWWKAALADGAALAAGNSAGMDFILGRISTADLAKLPPSPAVHTALITRDDASDAQRLEALQALAKSGQATPGTTLLQVLKPILPKGGAPVESLSRMLLLQPAAELQALRPQLGELLATGVPETVRLRIIAAMMLADGSLDPTWKQALQSPKALTDWLRAVPLLPDSSLRADAYDKAKQLVPTLPDRLQTLLKSQPNTQGRYVRIELPRRGTLTLAEVEVFSGNRNIAPGGKARQSSTDYGAVASRAIDGKTYGSFGSGTQTHTTENENRPWWEVDLGGEAPIESVAVWSRTDDGGRYIPRLAGYDLVILDAQRREIFRKSGNPAPDPSATLAVAEEPAAALKRAAIQALVSTGREPAALFGSLTRMISNQDQVDAAALALRSIPRSAWSKKEAAASVAPLLAWASEVPAAGRTSQEFVELIQTANDLAGFLPAQEAAAARKTLRNLGVSVFVVKTVREEMRYDTDRLVVEAGKPFEVIFENPDLMPHNILFVTPGSRKEIAEAVQASPPSQLDRQGRAYVPENDPRVFAASKMLEPGQKETLHITAPAEEGEYEYVCTFPGHWTIMWGTLVVTKDVDAYLQTHPVSSH